MSPPEPPNPERRSDSALLLMCIAIALLGLSWLLGFGGVLAAVFAGDAGALAAGGLAGVAAASLLGIVGAILLAVSAVWLFVRVVADQREGHRKDRYSREVER